MKKIFAAAATLSLSVAGTASNVLPDTARVVDIDEVVVVASPKENVLLRSQPVSTTLFSTDNMQSLGITSTKGLSGFVHNLYIPDYGSRLTSSMYIRGIGSRMNTPAVAMYVDDMPFADKSAYDFTFLDIDRIDVMNGPQGTLYGRNSMGGLIKVYTADPMRRQGTKISAGITGRTTGRRVSITTNQKLSDKFAFSAGAYYNAENGFFRNDSTNRKIDDSREAGARLRAVYRAGDNLKFDMQANYSYCNEGAYPYYYTGKAPASESAETYPDYTGKITANRESSYRRNLFNAGLNVTYKNPTYTLSSVMSYQFLNDRMYMDQDFIAADIYSLEQRQRAQTISEELTLRTTGNDTWNSTTGVFAMYQHMHTTSPVTFYADGMSMLNSTIAASMPSPSYTNPMTGRPVSMEMSLMLTDPTMKFDGNHRTPLTNIAVFHQSVIKDLFVRHLSLTLGARLDFEHQKLDSDTRTADIAYRFATAMTQPADLATYVRTGGVRKDDYLQLLPKAALQYDFNNRAGNVYIALGKGYRSGGYNIQMASEPAQTQLQGNLMQGAKGYADEILQQQIDNARNETLRRMFEGIKQMVDESIPEVSAAGVHTLRYKPEYSYNYEAGTHLNLLEHRLKIDAAVFFMDTHDQQIAKYSASGLGRQMINAGRSHSCGAEIGIRAAMADNRLNISGTYGFTHAEFDKYDDGKHDYAGNYVPMTPMHNMSLAASYLLPLKSNTIRSITFGADIIGLGRIYWTEQNDTYQNFYTNTGAHISLDLGFARLDLWGKNITNARYDTFYFESMNRGFRQAGNPCRFGADITFCL